MEIFKLEDISTKTGTSVLIYSPPGYGKTTFLGTLPGKTLIIDTDKGTKVIAGCENSKNITIARIKSIEDLEQIAKSLMKECKYDNVCIDTLTEVRLSSLVEASEKNCTKEGVRSFAPQLQDYLQATYKMSNVLRNIRTLVDDGADVYFTAWETSFEVTDKMGNKTNQAIPLVGGGNGVAATEISGMVDITARIRDNDGQRVFQIAPVGEDCIAKTRKQDTRKFCRMDELLTGLKAETTEESE